LRSAIVELSAQQDNGVLAIFPALIALVSIIGLIGSSATQPLLDNLGKVAPGPAKEILTK
jgi:membrane protein